MNAETIKQAILGFLTFIWTVRDIYREWIYDYRTSNGTQKFLGYKRLTLKEHDDFTMSVQSAMLQLRDFRVGKEQSCLPSIYGSGCSLVDITIPQLNQITSEYLQVYGYCSAEMKSLIRVSQFTHSIASSIITFLATTDMPLDDASVCEGSLQVLTSNAGIKTLFRAIIEDPVAPYTFSRLKKLTIEKISGALKGTSADPMEVASLMMAHIKNQL